MEKKIFLSIETSLNRIYLTLINSTKVYSIKKAVSRSIEVDINILLKKLFLKAGLFYEQLDSVLVSLGPGSFTGVRVGLSVAKAITSSLNIKLYGYSNFFSIFQQAKKNKIFFDKKDIDILIQATKYDFYYQQYFTRENKFGKIMFINNRKFENLIKKNTTLIGVTNCLIKKKDFIQVLPGKKSFLEITKDSNFKYLLKGTDLSPIYVKQHYAKKNI